MNGACDKEHCLTRIGTELQRTHKLICEFCGRQFTNTEASTEYETPRRGAFRGIAGFICAECAEDLDYNGNHPEEY